MTGENRARNAKDERVFANEFLLAAEALAQARLWNRAISQLYFCLLHAGRALLYSEGIEAKSHKATRSLLSLHFVKAGLLPSSVTKTLADLQHEREDADYLAQFNADEPFFIECQVQARAALAHIDALLAKVV